MVDKEVTLASQHFYLAKTTLIEIGIYISTQNLWGLLSNHQNYTNTAVSSL